MQALKNILLLSVLAIAPSLAGASEVFGDCVMQGSKTFDAKTLSLVGVYQQLSQSAAVAEVSSKALQGKIQAATSCREINLLLVDAIKEGLLNSK